MMSEENSISRGKKLTVALHILVWSILLGIPAYFMRRYDVDRNFVLLYYVTTTINGIIFYGNYLILVPRYFFIPRRRKYFLFTGLLVIACYFISDFSNQLIFREGIVGDQTA